MEFVFFDSRTLFTSYSKQDVYYPFVIDFYYCDSIKCNNIKLTSRPLDKDYNRPFIDSAGFTATSSYTVFI